MLLQGNRTWRKGNVPTLLERSHILKIRLKFKLDLIMTVCGYMEQRRAGAILQLWSVGFLLQWLLGARLQQSQHVGSRVWAQQLSGMGSVAPWHVASSQIRDQTHVPCIGKRIFILCTREVHSLAYLYQSETHGYESAQNVLQGRSKPRIVELEDQRNKLPLGRTSLGKVREARV